MIAAAAAPSPLWYLARGAGAVTLVLLTGTLLLGIGGSLRWRPSGRTPRFLVDGLHRNVSLLAVTFLGLHIVTAILDPFAHMHLLDAVVPLASHYRPLWVGLGALAFDLLLAVLVTSLVRRRLGLRAWKAVHWAAYACWPVAVLHGLGTGTDASALWFEALAAVCVFAVLVAIASRLVAGWPDRAGLRLAGLAAAGAAVAGGVTFASWGPLASGWARRAGTPTKLLASVRPARAVVGAAAAARPAGLRLPFSAPLRGTVTSSGSRVDIVAAVATSPAARVRVRILGIPVAGGGLQMTSSDVRLGTPALPDQYQGRLVVLQGGRLEARLRGSGSQTVDLRMALDLQPGSSQVAGTASAGSGG